MQIVIPMSGNGDRFRRAGYTEIKPLIRVDGKPMIEHVVRLFPEASDFLFICSQKHLDETPLRSELQRIQSDAEIVGIDPHKLGPVHTALKARSFIKDDQPIILNYCDFFAEWDYADFQQTVRDLDCDGCITAYRGFHPHSLGPNLYAYMRTVGNQMTEIREKHCFTDDRQNEFASAGTYYFKSGRLLKQTFDEAVNQKLSTNGEFYASTPFNLLVQKGRKVHIYELRKFLQWGTPEDLEEYQGWSHYFQMYRNWRPSLPVALGTNLIPIAGTGERFKEQGYVIPKPFIPIAGRPMIRRSLETFPPAKDWTIVTVTGAVEESALEARVSGLIQSGLHIVTLSAPTAGQADTCLKAGDRVDPDRPLLIAPCDAAVVYDERRYLQLLESQPDCIVWTFRNHPHANRNPRQYGWVRTTEQGSVVEVSCKKPISETVKFDPGVIGIFWFREARIFEEAAKAMIASGARVGTEFYVDVAINNVIERGYRVDHFDVEHFVCFGTPDDLRTYEYWSDYFR